MKTTDITRASSEWANRPKDERFSTIAEFAQFIESRTNSSREGLRESKSIKVDATGSDLFVEGPRGKLVLNNYSAAQMARIAGLAPSLIQTFANVPEVDLSQAAAWAAEGMNLGLQARNKRLGQEGNREKSTLNFLVDMRDMSVRAVTTEAYTRIWDQRIVQDLILPLQEAGFTNLPAMDGPAGLYASDRDMFFFLAPPSMARINMPGQEALIADSSFQGFEINGQIFHPFILGGNNEVGNGSAWFMSGLAQKVCGNHIIWGAGDVQELRVPHRGDQAAERLLEGAMGFMRQWTSAGTLAERQAIKTAMTYYVGKTEEEAVSFLQRHNITKARSLEAVATVKGGDLSTGIISQDPTVLFNLVSALTAGNRNLSNMDQRAQEDRKASSLLSLVQ